MTVLSLLFYQKIAKKSTVFLLYFRPQKLIFFSIIDRVLLKDKYSLKDKMKPIKTKEDVTKTILLERKPNEMAFVFKQDENYVVILCEKMKQDFIVDMLHSNIITNPRYFGYDPNKEIGGNTFGWEDKENKRIVIYSWSWHIIPSKNVFTYNRAHEYLQVPDVLIEEFPVLQ